MLYVLKTVLHAISGSALDEDSPQELSFLNWLLQGHKSFGPCLRVHAQRGPAESSERLFILSIQIYIPIYRLIEVLKRSRSAISYIMEFRLQMNGTFPHRRNL
jgi:hypothetical protein